MRPRLGAVEFLNTRPLTAVLEADHDFELGYAVPSTCAEDLAAGRTDLGLIPSIEYARSNDPYCIVPGVSISSVGEVLTVRLYLGRPLAAVQRIALDTSSRTSAALLRILMNERYGRCPEVINMEPNLEIMLQAADAALLIGDTVLALMDSGCPSLDLGREWADLTGLPMVFAFWAGRQGALTAEQSGVIRAARCSRRADIRQIASHYACQHGGSPSIYERYLSEHIRYDFGPEEQAGLETFYALAYQYGLIDSVPSLRFF